MTIASPESLRGKAIIREEDVVFPTYGVGEPDPNPMFFERRVYQGSSGRVYPYPLIETVSDAKGNVTWRAVILENEFLKVMVLPQLGGRIHMALDKTNNYHFIYFNRVIKPALVGLAGPWISGGIEFNWPQHHRPSTYQPLDHTICSNADGSVTVWLGEIEHMSRLRGLIGITLRPDVARIDIEGVSHNRTNLPQTMLWWANPAVAVNDDYQSIFPPDVQAVMDHGKRDVSRFPIAVGTYYNQDYSHGVDISWYKNIPVPSSYMVAHSNYDFCGGYDHGKRAGLLHVADHHVSPGKKQWTWGSGDFGKVWIDHLTDQDGPYIELMTGVYTDNQPDFAWLQPGETRRFRQSFFPCRDIGHAHQANIEAALSLEITDGHARCGLYATASIPNATVRLTCQQSVLLEDVCTIAPDNPFTRDVELGTQGHVLAHQYRLSMMDANGREIIAWSPEPPREVDIPKPAQAAQRPEDIKTNEELFLTGLHLEQYRHATRDPDPYYLEGLKRDPDDARCNNAYGLLLLRRGNPRAAVSYFQRAVARLTIRNGNPYDGEPLHNLGYALELIGKVDEAYDAYGKATWNEAWRSAASFGMARIDCKRGDHACALRHVETALDGNPRNARARHLKTVTLRLLGVFPAALQTVARALASDPLDPGALFEQILVREALAGESDIASAQSEFAHLTRNHVQTIIELSLDYLAMGRLNEAARLLEQHGISPDRQTYPMVLYLLAVISLRQQDTEQASRWQELASRAQAGGCFPHRIEEALVLEEIVAAFTEDARALYYLGNHHYDARRHEEAIALWERSRSLDPGFATTRRNLALAYYNKRGDGDAALRELSTAFELNPSDVRVFFELDQLRKKLNHDPRERLRDLASHRELVEQRDALYLEFVTLHNRLGEHAEALRLLAARHFHPWEGGEGRVAQQYQFAHVRLAVKALADGSAEEALAHLKAASEWPRNLGEGRLEGTRENHIEFHTARALWALEREAEATAMLQKAASGSGNLAMSMFYYDQPADLFYYQGLALAELGRHREAAACFNRLVDHGERHLHDRCEIDYFAISLPNFLVFDDDLDLRNRLHCLYLMALGHAGKGDYSKASTLAHEGLRLDTNHLGLWALLQDITREEKP